MPKRRLSMFDTLDALIDDIYNENTEGEDLDIAIKRAKAIKDLYATELDAMRFVYEVKKESDTIESDSALSAKVTTMLLGSDE